MEFFSLLGTYLPTLLWGAWMTLLISGTAIVLGMPLGLLLCFGLVSKHTVLRRLALIYQSAWRGTPILVQLFIIFYLLPSIGIDVPPVIAAIIALTMNTAAFQAEIFRGGLLAIPSGQMEAARMVGIQTWPARIHIIIPQIFRLVLPSLVNETISILKNSSLVSVIAVTELMRVSQQIVAVNYRAFEIYTMAAIIYLIMTLGLSFMGRYAEQRLALKR
ncbi:amino acid ABC transporter permease [Rhodoligotrophos ferricapiens]|uniref:amino acid ABC transporter permease n=1 Tax=Rhodoligotrophos ferricapiens TaxID=3069264 RepID=UPI00315D80AA